MGSWNVTCGLSGLPIQRGDAVKLIILVANDVSGHETRLDKDKNDFCIHNFTSASHYWNPILFPISGKYDDYGSIEKIKIDDNVKHVVDFFNSKESCFKVSCAMRNREGKINIKEPLFNIESILSAIERGYIRKVSIFGNLSDVRLMFVKEDVYKLALSTVSKMRICYGGVGTPTELLEMHGKRDVKFRQETENSMASLLRKEPRKVSPILTVLSESHEMGFELPNDIECDASPVMEKYGKEAFAFNMFLMEFGKFYTPAPSQCCDHYDMDSVVKFNTGCLKIANKLKEAHDRLVDE